MWVYWETGIACTLGSSVLTYFCTVQFKGLNAFKETIRAEKVKPARKEDVQSWRICM